MSQYPGTVESTGQERDAPMRTRFGPLFRPALSEIARYWWVELVAGVRWLVIAAVMLKFNHASVVTAGGLVLLLFAAENFVLAAADRHARWLWIMCGVLLTAAGIVSLIQPVDTFTEFAEILGFVFLLIGISYTLLVFAGIWTLMAGITDIVRAFQMRRLASDS